jgi:hypothetical protein
MVISNVGNVIIENCHIDCAYFFPGNTVVSSLPNNDVCDTCPDPLFPVFFEGYGCGAGCDDPNEYIVDY